MGFSYDDYKVNVALCHAWMSLYLEGDWLNVLFFADKY